MTSIVRSSFTLRCTSRSEAEQQPAEAVPAARPGRIEHAGCGGGRRSVAGHDAPVCSAEPVARSARCM